MPPAPNAATRSHTPLRDAIARHAATIAPARSHAMQPGPTARHRAAVKIGIIGGLIAGALVGAAIEGDRCGCDDPGLTGSLIGMPIGAVIGGVLAARLVR